MTVWWDEDPFMQYVAEGAAAGVIAACEGALAEGTRLIMSPPKTGRIYKRAGRTHQASAPGQPPANDLGALVASGRVIGPQRQGDLIRGLANWSTQYALYLEVGTSRMEPRPYARPALDFVSAEFAGMVAGGISARVRL